MELLRMRLALCLIVLIQNFLFANEKKDRVYGNYDTLLEELYKFTTEEQWLPQENRYGVLGSSVFAIQHALVSVLKKPTEFIGGREHYPWVERQEAALNDRIFEEGSDTLYIYNMGYLRQPSIQHPELGFVVIDASWLPHMHQSYPAQAPVYLFSASLLCFQRIKLSFAFFEDEELARKVQERLIFQTAGVRLEDLLNLQKAVEHQEEIRLKFAESQKVARQRFEDLVMDVREFNLAEGAELQLSLEPDLRHAFLTGDSQELKHFEHEYQPGLHSATIKYSKSLYDPSKENLLIFELLDWGLYESRSATSEDVDKKDYLSAKNYRDLFN